MKKVWKQMLATALCLAILLSAGAAPSYAVSPKRASETEASDEDASYKDKVNDLNDRIEALKKEQEAIQAEIDKTKGDKEKKEKEKKELQNQIYLAQQEIELLTERIGALEDNITQKEHEIEQKQAEIDENYDLYLQRLNVMYKKNDATALGVIFGADSYAEFLSGAEMMRRVSEHDDKLIESLVQAKHDIEDALAEIQENKAQVEEDKADMDAQKSNLNTKVEQVAQQEMQLADLQKEFEAQMEQKLQEEKEAQAEIKRIIAENSTKDEYVGGEFIWPVSGYNTITSPFGWRFGGSDFHTGIDIAGRNAAGTAIFQQPIRAANSGKVIYASNNYTPGRGYGRYVIIDHGGGKSTLYGHQNQVYVSVGDTVAQGDIIGEVGTTGWSTGPHLHFEIRENGEAQNPMNYFSKAGG